MKAEELDLTERNFLENCHDYPDMQYIGASRTTMNTLDCYGLVRYAGSMKYELTEDGLHIIKEIKECTHEVTEKAHPSFTDLIKDI